MTKCPKCNEEIDELWFSKTKEINGSVGLDNDNCLEFDEDYDIFEEQKPYTFGCSECGEALFNDDEEVEEFLKNDELQEIVKEKIENISREKLEQIEDEKN